MAYLNDVAPRVDQIVARTFGYLYGQLEPVEREVVCGIFRYRIYTRMAAPTLDLSSDSGRCLSVNWFANMPGHECPRRDNCGAYTRPVPLEEFTLWVPEILTR